MEKQIAVYEVRIVLRSDVRDAEDIALPNREIEALVENAIIAAISGITVNATAERKDK